MWLPEDAKDTVLAGGYYTVSPHKGFRMYVAKEILKFLTLKKSFQHIIK